METFENVSFLLFYDFFMDSLTIFVTFDDEKML